MPRGLSGKQEATNAEWGILGEVDTDFWEFIKKNEDTDQSISHTESFFVGEDGVGNLLGWKDNTHVFLAAANRSGKGTGLIIPNLRLHAHSSVLVIDPKGENAQVTATYRRDVLKQKVIVLDPFKQTEIETPLKSFNPLDSLNLNDTQNVIDDVSAIADALIVGNTKDSYWSDRARSLLKAIILIVLHEDFVRDSERNLTTVRQIQKFEHESYDNFESYYRKKNQEIEAFNKRMEATGKPHRVEPKSVPSRPEILWKFMEELASEGHPSITGILKGTAEIFKNIGERELGSILSSLDSQLEFLDGISMQEVLKTPKDADGNPMPFRMGDMKKEPISLYLCLPAGRMVTHSKWLRMIITLTLIDFERIQNQKDSVPLTMFLDEFPVLGHMKDMENAVSYIAGFGVRMFFVVQSLALLKAHYKDTWHSFLGNSGLCLFFGNSDGETLNYISSRLGKITMRVKSNNPMTDTDFLHAKPITSEQFEHAALLEPHEIELLLQKKTQRIMVLTSGFKPLILKRAKYYEKGDPFHIEG